jgi:hypothetical protein
MVLSPRAKVLLSAVVAAALFTIGYFIAMVVPGGGRVTPEEITSFYAEEGNQSLTLMLAIALAAGSLALVWFFNELRARLPETTLTRVGYAAATIDSADIVNNAVRSKDVRNNDLRGKDVRADTLRPGRRSCKPRGHSPRP